MVAVGVSTSRPSIPHVLWTSTFHASAAEPKRQEQSLFAEMEQEHEQASTVNGKVGLCDGDGAGFAGPTERMDVRCRCSSRYFTENFVGALHPFVKCPWFMCNKDQWNQTWRISIKSQNSQEKKRQTIKLTNRNFTLFRHFLAWTYHIIVQLAQCPFCIGVVCRARRGAGLVIGS